jgi:formyl-CoA transferase
VFVQNLAPGAAARLGLDAASLTARYPKLIPCTISGYGEGPWADRKAYDLLVQCQTGLVSLTGTPEGAARVGISVADIAAGMYAYSGILTALFSRATTGGARSVDVSLFDALAEWMGQPAYYTRYGGTQPPRVGTQHATISPYGAYTAADGKDVLFSIQNEREWIALCKQFLGRPELIDDPRYATGSARVQHRDEVNAIVAQRFSEIGSDEVMSMLDDAGIANAGVNSVQEFLEHPVLTERGRWQDIGIPGATVQAMLPPVNLAGVTARMDPVPDVGEHTEPILSTLGYSADEIQELREERIV